MKRIVLYASLIIGVTAGIASAFIFIDGATAWALDAIESGKGTLAHLIAIVLLLLFGPRLWRRILDRIIRKIPQSDKNFVQRLETIKRLLLPIGNITVLFIILMIAMDIFSIDIRPILAGLGIVGLALGFGIKNIVEDFISGTLILWENQYSVGEKVKIGTFEGTVLRLTLRMTFLTSEDGEISIPNRIVANSGVTNQSRK